MKNIFEAIKALALFKKYTTMPRWMEIGYSIQFWLCVFIIIYAILK